MKPLLAVLWSTAVVAGCGGSEEPTPRPELPDPQSRGATVLEGAGCLACHRLAQRGNSGPGQDLDRVGARRSRAEIREALVAEPESMPSYENLPEPDFDALVAYLAALK